MNEITKQILLEVNIQTDKLKADVIEMNQELDKLLERQKDLTDSGQKNSKVYQDIAAQIRITRDALSDATGQIDSNTKALNLNQSSLQQNKALLQALQQQYDYASKSQGNHSQSAKELNIQIGQLTATIDNQEKKLAKSRETFDFHKGSVDNLKNSFSDIKDKAGDFAPALQSVSTGFNTMKSGLSVVKTGFQGVGGAIKATGFGLLVMVLQSVVEYFTNTAEGSIKLRQLLAGLNAIVNNLKGSFSNAGKIIVEAFTNPIDGLKRLGNMIEENIINRVKAFAVIYEGITKHDFSKIANGVLQLGTGVKNLYTEAKKAYKDAGMAANEAEQKSQTLNNAKTIHHQQQKQQIKEISDLSKQADDERIASIARMGQKVLEGYTKEITDTDNHFKKLQQKYKDHKATVEQLEKERTATLEAIEQKFQNNGLKKLAQYEKELTEISKTAREQALDKLYNDYNKKTEAIDKIKQQNEEILKNSLSDKTRKQAQEEINQAEELSKKLKEQYDKNVKLANQTFDKKDKKKAEKEKYDNQKDNLESNIANDQKNNDWKKEFDDKQKLLNLEYQQAISAEGLKQSARLKIEQDYKKKSTDLDKERLAAEVANQKKYVQGLDSLATAVTSIFGKNTVAARAAFKAHQAAAAAQVIIDTRQSIMGIWKANSGLPLIGVAKAIAETAIVAATGASNLASILKQKPGFAKGGRYVSDGRGAVLSGYSRMDNTNAYLRSGEAVVVSEAMRNPWARNLVSAVNVAFGGRDFSMPNPGKGYAIGGIFTDGGNANRYYSQPVNDVKDMANTLAYQMLNNFPPIYVDVKDINNQQNILAQTVNRVNL